MNVCPLCEQPVEDGRGVWTSLPDRTQMILEGRADKRPLSVGTDGEVLDYRFDHTQAILDALDYLEVETFDRVLEGSLCGKNSVDDETVTAKIKIDPPSKPSPDHYMHEECHDELF